jgi:hypothetical protein
LRRLTISIVVILITLGAGCSNEQEISGSKTSIPTAKIETTSTILTSPKTTHSPKPSAVPATEPLEQRIRSKADQVLNILKNKDMIKLAEYIHPDLGVRFSPYSFVDTEHNLVFKADQIKAMKSDTAIYTWGNYDGSGEPIKLTFEKYFNQFIYDHDYSKAKEIAYDHIIGKGTMKNNVQEAYKDAHFVEYHFSGFDSIYDGNDWKSLRIMFSEKNNEWYIVGIEHDQWTI